MKLTARLKRIAAAVAARTPPPRRWPRIVLPGTEVELLAAGVDPASVHPRPGERRLMIPDHGARFAPEPGGGQVAERVPAAPSAGLGGDPVVPPSGTDPDELPRLLAYRRAPGLAAALVEQVEMDLAGYGAADLPEREARRRAERIGAKSARGLTAPAR